jgi:DNA polymerase-4
MERKIIHVDLDAFFCAVEELYDPSLVGIPFAVGGSPDKRGVISSCSYAARLLGIRSAMPSARALKIYPQLKIIHSRHRQYSQISDQVMVLVHNLSPDVEQISVDEAFIDVSDLKEDGFQLARQLQKTIHTNLKLPCSLGVATNKLVAKIANDVGKKSNKSNHPPNAITVVPPGEEASFLSPLPVDMLWGVGPKTSQTLEKLGIRTVGDLAHWNVTDLIERFGKMGQELSIRAQGIDTRPISVTQEIKSISQETTFSKDIDDRIILRKTISNLAEHVGQRLRRSGYHCSTIKLKIRWQDFTTLTRQTTLDKPTDQDKIIIDCSLQLFENVWHIGKKVRLLGVGVSGLNFLPSQLTLWDISSEKDKHLQEAIDQLRTRYGNRIILRGADTE